MTPEEIVAASRPTTSGVHPTRPFIENLVAQLSDTDDLEAAVELAVAEYKRSEAVALIIAAIVLERPCRAELVGRAMWFLPTQLFGAVMLHSPGDRVAAVVHAMNSRRFDALAAIQASAVALAFHPEGPLDPDLARAFRMLARENLPEPESATFGSLLHGVTDASVREAAAIHLERFAREGRTPQKLDLEPVRGKIYELLPATSITGILSGPTIRHTARVGRNDPCPCGSGRKLKKCCIAKYEEGLADASPVPGVTMLEYRRQAHRYLDEEELPKHLDLFDLAQLPIDELDTHQLIAVYTQLARGRVWAPAERMLVAIEARTDRGLLRPIAEELLEAARGAGETALLRRNADRLLRQRQELLRAELALMEPNEGVDAIEEFLATSLRQIDGDDERHATNGRHAIGWLIETASKHRPALGLMLLRGTIASKLDAVATDGLLRGLVHARDLLGLPGVDPIAEYVDEGVKEAADAGADELLEAMRRENERLADEAETALDALRNARGQSRRIRTRLDGARKQLRELENELDVVTGPDPRVAGLQQMVAELESKALELEDDKQTLHAQLSDMEQEFAARAPSSTPRSSDGEDLYDDDATPPTFVQVLVPEWTTTARAELGVLDAAVAAHTLDLVARVASGRAGEGARVKKLKGKGELWSARVGIGHRVLFRFDASEGLLRILHVTPRKDLERLLRGI